MISDPPQRVAVVTPRFSEEGTIGGAETLLKQFAGRLASAGMDVTVLTTCAQDHFSWSNSVSPGRRKVDNYTVELFEVDENRDVAGFLSVQDRLCAGHKLSSREEYHWINNHVRSSALCRHLASDHRYEAILVGPYLLGLTFEVTRVHPSKTILVPCLHDEPFAYVRPFKSMFESVAGLIFNTLPEYELACRLFDLEHRNCQIVGIGMEDNGADPCAFRQRHDIQLPYALYSGRREPMKGTGLLIEYFHKYINSHGRQLVLVLSGSGPVDIPSELRDHVLDVGVLDPEEKFEAMAGAAVFVHPSVNESLSIVLLEALVSGTPVLVNRGSEVLSHHVDRSGAGHVFHDYKSFAGHLSSLLEAPEHARRLGKLGNRYVKQYYDWEQVDRRLLSALKRLQTIQGSAF